MTDTGRFFGELEKAVMESMLYANIFKKVIVYDLQALCKNITEIRDPDDQSASPGLVSVRYLLCLIQIIFFNFPLFLYSHSSYCFLDSNGC